MKTTPRLVTTACAAALALLANAARADVTVVPGALAAVEGNGSNQNPLNNAGATAQLLISASQLSDLSAGDVITGFRFRLNDNAPVPAGVASWSNYEITLAQLATSVASPSNVFATNMTSPVLVRNGGLTFATNAFPTGGSPNAFGPLIAFNQAAYTYQGGDLAVLITHDDNNLPSPLAVDSANSMTAGYGTDFRALLVVNYQSIVATNNTGSFPAIQFEFTPVPEPGSWTFAGTGAAAATLVARRRRRSLTN